MMAEELWRGFTIVDNLTHEDDFKAGGQWHTVDTKEYLPWPQLGKVRIVTTNGDVWTFECDTSIACRVYG